MIQFEYKVTVSEDATFRDRWMFSVWERPILEDRSRGEWTCIRRRLATYHAWKQHSRMDLKRALQSLL